MSEVQPRPSAPRGRGSGRGGRGGYSSRGSRNGPRPTNGEKSDVLPTPSYEDEGELGQLKKQYASKLSTIKEMFPGWTDEDIVFALQETDGDLEGTIDRMSEGNISQWGEVKKKTKDRARSKVKEASSTATDATAVPSRGGRGRGGSDGSRGGRGRATDRGRGASRGLRGGIGANGNRTYEKGSTDVGHDASTNTGLSDSTSALETPTIASDQAGTLTEAHNRAGTASPDASWELVTPVDSTPAPAAEGQKASSKPDGSRSWASIFAKPVPVSARPKPIPATPTLPVSEIIPEAVVSPEVEQEAQIEEPGLPPPVPLEEPIIDDPSTPNSTGLSAPEEAINITPSKDELTETNLEQVLDTSGPPATATAASTVASTQDPRSVAGGSTPLHSAHGQPGGLRPGLGGFATSAYKATGGSGRSASFQRRVMEQQEAVVMPGNHAMDRAAVQFGSMGLNGTSEDLDVDDDREDAETRTQPPQHSPVAPRAALPPATPQYAAETLPTPRAAPGLPPAAPQALSQQGQPAQQADQALLTPSNQGTYPYHQFNNRYGPPTSQQDVTGPTQKAYEPFGQQIQQPTVQQHQFDGYPSQSQATSQQQPSSQSGLGTYSSAANDYPSYYTSDNQRNAYQNYYGNYGQPGQQTQPDTGAAQPRAGSAFGSSGIEQPTQYATSQVQQPPQARYGSAGDVHDSGHSTPNPILGQGQISAQPSHQMPQQQSQGQAGGQPGAYPYGHPYYNSPYYYNQVSQHSYGRDRPAFDDVRRQYEDQYLTHNHQFGYGASQGGYGTGPYGAAGSKQGMYGQPHQGYGMSPQTTYDHHSSSSPANVGGYGQRDGTSSGLGAYGRTGSAQTSENQQHNIGSAGAFGSMPEGFGRSQAGYSTQGQNAAQQQGGPQSGNDESSRAYGDAPKMAAGPSPAPGQISGRPGSATNTMQVQAGLPTSQGQGQAGYSNFPSQMNPQMHGQQPSQYATGLGALGSHHQAGGQSHQGSGYGGGYAGAFGGNFYGSNNRGGWGGNYGH
ncbi:RNAPII degradation factor [Xylographa trunciseda]|nr:RNAPII degradation factor [Xylographa trunciseda]